LIKTETGFRKFWWISWISIFRPTGSMAVCGYQADPCERHNWQ